MNRHIATFCIWATLLVAAWMPISSYGQAPTCVGGITLTYSVTNSTCNGANDGKVTVTINGATGNYLIFLISGNNPGQNFFNATVNTFTFTGLQPDGLMQISAQASVGAGFGICNVMGLALTEPPAITDAPTLVNPTCNGGTNGSISPNISGGTPGYTFSWSNGASTQNISGLAAGSYTLTVTDANNCVKVFPYTLTAPPAITATPTITNPSCFGGTNGSINIAVSNGTAPYTYAWSNGASTQNISGLTAGSYSVTITDANLCSIAIGPFTVTSPTAVTAPAPAIVSPTCNGGTNGSIDITPSGGTAPYTYAWSNGASTQDLTGIAAGSYSLVLTDGNSCPFNFGPYTVTQPSGVTVPAPAITNISCNGGNNGAIDITPTGGIAPYTYSWSTGATTQDISGLATGNYSVTIRDNNGCIFNFGPYTITQPAVLTVPAPAITNVLCNGGNTGAINITPAGGTAPYTFTWSNGATTEDLSGLAIGSYSVTVKDANNCTANGGPYTITQPAALSIPSPLITNVLCNGGSTGVIDISPAGGTLPYTYLWSNGAVTQDLSGRPAGTYSVVLTDANGCTINGGPYTITQPTALTVPAPVITPISCSGGNNGAIDITPTGGTAPYTYLWSNGFSTQDISSLSAGSYSVNIRDANNCFTSAGPYTINPAVAITVPAPVIVNVNCNGTATGSIDITPSGGTTPYTYTWTNGANTQDISGLAAGSYSVVVKDANNCTFNAGPYTITQPSAITVPAPAITNINCNGGTTGAIDITPSGGTVPYTYTWSNGATTQDLSGVAAGSYTVTVKDANLCTLVFGPYTITQPPAITVTATTTNILCNGGSTGAIDITPAGGNAPYTYSWTNGASTQDLSGLAAGTYTVTITDASLCSINQPYTITEAPALVVTGTPVNITCNGAANGQVNVSVSGGTAPYTYAWSNGAITQNLSGLAAGNYTVTVKDASNCTIVAGPFTITEPPALTVSGVVTDALCTGINTGAIDITPAGGVAPYTYSWSNGASTQDLSAVAAGSYTVTITDASLCTTSASYTIATSVSVSVSLTPTNITCFGANTGSITSAASSGTPPYTYSWSNGAITQNISGLTAGSYTLTVTDNSGCTATASATLTEPTAISVTASIVNVGCNGGSTGSIDITPTGGVAPYSYLWSNGFGTQDISGLSAGSYSVNIRDANNCNFSAGPYTITEPAGLVVTGTPVDITCNGAANGQVNLTVTGGTTPYSYAWSNGASTQNISGLSAGSYTVTITDATSCPIVAGPFTVSEPTALTVSGTATNALCSGVATGSVDITPAGGTGVYTYSWDNGATTQDLTNVAPGSYTVTVTDANLCTTSGTYVVAASVTVNVSLTPTDVSCFGGNNGSVTSSVSSGTTPYTYLWSNGASTANISSVIAGTYTLTVTDNVGCTATASATVNEPAGMTISGVVTNVPCSGGSNGSIDLSVSGGLAPYTYNWSNGASTEDISGLVANTYTVSVTDANLCSQNSSFTITQSTLSGTSVVTDESCSSANGAIDFTPSGGTAPYTFSWSNGATTEDLSGLTAGSYTLTYSDAGACSDVVTIVVASIPLPNVAVTPASPSICNGSSVLLSASGALTYTWSPATNLSATTGTTVTANPTTTTTYTVTGTDAGGCTNTANVTVTVNPTPTGTASASPSTLCAGNATVITAVIDAPFIPAANAYSFDGGVTFQASSTFNISAINSDTTVNVVIADANGCSTAVIPVSITLTHFVTTLTLVPPTCNGGTDGSINVDNVTGGNAPYTYAINGGTFGTATLFSGLSAGSQTVSVTDNIGCRFDTTVTLTQPNVLSLSVVIPIDSICASSTSGIANLTASGGTPAYTYSSDGVTFVASSSFTTLGPAVYTFTVKDLNGCTATSNGTINSFPVVNIGAIVPVQQDLTCNGVNTGRIQLTNILGGTRPFMFSLDGGTPQTDSLFINLSGGPHTITISDAKGCTYDYTFTINSPAPIDFDINILQLETCNNGDGILQMTNITGGVSPYTYSFNGGAVAPYIGSVTQSNLVTNTYTFTVNDASVPGCSLTKNVVLPKKPGPIPYVRVNDAICYNGFEGSVVVDSVQGGAAPFQYYFNNTNYGGTTVFSNLSEGYYTLDIQDMECVYDIQTFYVWNPDSMYYDTLYNDSLYVGEGLPITGSIFGTNSANHLPTGTVGVYDLLNGTSPYQYSFDSITFQTLIGDSIIEAGLPQGTYPVFVVDSNGCTARFDITIKDMFFIPNLITPNGDQSNDYFEIVGLPAKSELMIVNRWGQKIYHSDDYTNNWDGETNSDGVYYYELRLKSGAEYKGWLQIMR